MQQKGRTLAIAAVLVVVLAVTGREAWYQLRYSPEDYRQTAASQPTIYRVALSTDGRALFEQGVAAVLANEFDDAADRFEALAKLEPRSAGALEQRGRVALLKGQRQDAEQHFAKAFGLAGGDPVLSAAMQRWIQIARSGNYVPLADYAINRQFPGQLPYFIEHRVRPAAEGFLGASHLLLGEHRVTFPTPVAVPFDLLRRAAPGHGTIVFGSSRAREGFKPHVFEAGTPAAFHPAVNVASSQSAPIYWRAVVQHLRNAVLQPGTKLHAAIILADPESLSDGWVRKFKPPNVLPASAWQAFNNEGRGGFELWPAWTGLSDAGPWQLVSNWAELAKDPFTNGLNHARQGTAYEFNGIGTVNRAAYIEVLKDLRDVVDKIYVVPIPLSPEQFALTTNGNSGYPDLRALTTAAGVTYQQRSPAEWGLDQRHFFGAKAYPLDKMDWWHLNYIGAAEFTKQLATLVR